MNKILKILYTSLTRKVHEIWAIFLPKSYAKYMYLKITGRKLNLDDPKDYNEKIEWLKIYSDTSEWTRCADKHRVREFIKEKGLEYILVKQYGVWDKAEEIDFDQLPDKFVFKTNHAFGTVMLVKDKSKLDIEKTRRQLNKWVNSRYGLVQFEPHYFNIKRKIIAEEFLEDHNQEKLSGSLIDYKFWCINGEPEIIAVIMDRPNLIIGADNEEKLSFRHCLLDSRWKVRNDIDTGGAPAEEIEGDIPKPKCFDEMLKICRILSEPFPTVRVDLYEVNNKVYFGELTFTPGGNRSYFSQEYFLELGEKMDITKVKRRKKRFIV